MSIVTGANTIIKENLLAQETVRLLDNKFVIAPFANTMYEWEIKQRGDTVSIETFPNIFWASATTAGETISSSAFVVTKDQLVIDQLATFWAKYSSLEDIQSNLPLASKIANRMVYGQDELIEKFIVKTAVAGAHEDNILWDLSVALTASTVAAAVEAVRTALEEQNVDVTNSALFVAPKIASIIRQSSYFDGFKEWLDVRRTGLVGRIAGLDVYVSNNIGYKCMLAMDRDSVHFAAQRTGFSDEKLIGAFSRQVSGEMAYGAKVCTENTKRIALYYYSN